MAVAGAGATGRAAEATAGGRDGGGAKFGIMPQRRGRRWRGAGTSWLVTPPPRSEARRTSAGERHTSAAVAFEARWDEGGSEGLGAGPGGPDPGPSQGVRSSTIGIGLSPWSGAAYWRPRARPRGHRQC